MSRRAPVFPAVFVVLMAMGVPTPAGASAAPAPGSARAQVAPSIVVTPATDLVEGQTVSVEGIGWVPGNTIGICQAIVLDPPGAANCHQGLYTSVIADSLGGFTVALTVHAEIDVPSVGHVVDCTGPSQLCVVGAADGADVVGTVTAVPIVFAETVMTVPGVPTGVSAVPGAGAVTVSWTAPASNGGSPLTGYWVTGYVGYWPTVLVRFESTATSQVITGLPAGTAHWFRVRAVNAVGRSGLSSATALVTPTVSVPGVPTGASAVAGAGQATVSWTAPASDGGSPVTGYWVTGYVGYWPTVLVRFDSTATSQVLTELSPGTAYWFRVRAVNAVGRSALSNGTNLVTPTA